ncbi:major capsid protein [Dipodfec virus UOA04_Rod_592]|nr:major capsid protein [Dipodfec virus UOA04_Rod_592]
MSNPFKPSNSVVNKPKRHSFDLSHSNHLTFRFGQLIPCLCEEVLPGDTFKIDAALGLRFMPLAFPIQTKCRAHVHFFYQRTKNIWKDFPDFIYGNDRLQGRTIVPPSVDFRDSRNQNLLRTCGLGDYLGLPTVRYSTSFVNGDFGVLRYNKVGGGKLIAFRYSGSQDSAMPPSASIAGSLLTSDVYNPLEPVTGAGPTGGVVYPYRDKYLGLAFNHAAITSGTTPGYSQPSLPLNGRYTVDVPSGYQFDLNDVYYGLYRVSVNNGMTSYQPQFIGPATAEPLEILDSDGSSSVGARVTFDIAFTKSNASLSFDNYFLCVFSRFSKASPDNGEPTASVSYTELSPKDAVTDRIGSPIGVDYPISALPFRCYESIYNAFYRDNRNNPFKASVDGKVMPVYNQYVTTDASGVDSTNYGIFNRNWELDQFTSATSSPQQGVAPLVGISKLGDVTFSYDGKEYTFTTETADDADTITKVNVTENIPDAVARSLVNVVTAGISINDFRNVNAYQRWLETNLRRGLKYKDQTLARWGTQPSDSTLDMPEFIGGFSVDVDINTVTNTSAADTAPLGDYAGQATAFGGSKHRISQYCDQHGFIMAIISVVPAPVYTQLLPKMFLRTSALDYYSPEFGQIGLQPIPYREICPLEIFSKSSPVKATSVFGYQRPWYEYIYRNDVAHGLFRTDFNQFLLSRTFNRPPTLGNDFLTIKESSLNDVFTVKNQNSILGMIRFNIEAQRPIPQVSVPSL